MISDWALVLEGGGMRGVFTSGVLDYLMDKNIYFPYTIGVSAGACNGLSYASKQRGRAKISNIDLLDKYHYISPKFFWSNKSILNMDFLFDEMPNKVLIPILHHRIVLSWLLQIVKLEKPNILKKNDLRKDYCRYVGRPAACRLFRRLYGLIINRCWMEEFVILYLFGKLVKTGMIRWFWS